MKTSVKVLVAMLLAFFFLAFGHVAFSYAEVASIEDRASAYIKNVLSLDFDSYNITFVSYELPGSPNATYRTDAVTFHLNSTGSSESLLAVNCLFRDGVQYTCDMRVLKGSPIYAEECSDLIAVTRRILERHQAQTGADSTELLRTLDMIKSTAAYSSVSRGSVTLTVSLGHVPTGLTMVNGSLHVDGKNMIGVTSFRWDCRAENGNDAYVLISYDNAVFHGIRDERILYGIGNDEEKTTVQADTGSLYLAVLGAGLPVGSVAGIVVLIHFRKRDA